MTAHAGAWRREADAVEIVAVVNRVKAQSFGLGWKEKGKIDGGGGVERAPCDSAAEHPCQAVWE